MHLVVIVIGTAKLKWLMSVTSQKDIYFQTYENKSLDVEVFVLNDRKVEETRLYTSYRVFRKAPLLMNYTYAFGR